MRIKSKSDVYSLLFDLKSEGLNIDFLIKKMTESTSVPKEVTDYFSNYDDDVIELFEEFKKKTFYKVLKMYKDEPSLELLISLNSFITHLLIEKRKHPYLVVYILHFIDIDRINGMVLGTMKELNTSKTQDLINEVVLLLSVLDNWKQVELSQPY